MNRYAIPKSSSFRFSGLAALACVSALSGCGDPCLDDGRGKAGVVCEGVTINDESGTATDTNESAEGMTETNDAGSESSDADAGSESDTTDTTDEGNTSTWCLDVDMDGFGDADECTEVPEGERPPAGSVPEDMATDCDDDDANTFPGAAELDDPADACMTDADMDGFGDDMPSSPEAVPGADCDDSNVDTYPGAAEIEGPDACMQDEDDDGYGEQMPPAGVAPGSDCDDLDLSIFMCTLWCPDNDGDGFADENMCVGVPPGEQPPEFFVEITEENPGDCADDNPDVFPGAAEFEPDLCTADIDDDGYGDDSITDTVPNADNGSDCLDSDANAFPGAAEIDDPNACLLDADMDGWGDSSPPDGVGVGRDCDDSDTARVVCVDASPSCADTNLGMGTQLDAIATGGDGNYTWLWDNESTLDDALISNPIALPTEITTYTATATDGLGNVGSDEVTVHLLDRPWVLGGVDAECMAFGFLGNPAPHSFANMNTTTCTTENADPTAYVCPTVHENARITGTMIVNLPVDDNDYIGFVWGWQNSDQYYMLHWKREAQMIGGCNSAAGITVKRFDRVQPYAAGDFTCNTSTPNQTVLLTPGQTTTQGWAFGVDYSVELLYANDQTEITVTDAGNNAVVANFVVMDDTYPSGQFGTYDYSQVQACNGPWNSSCL